VQAGACRNAQAGIYTCTKREVGWQALEGAIAGRPRPKQEATRRQAGGASGRQEQGGCKSMQVNILVDRKIESL